MRSLRKKAQKKILKEFQIFKRKTIYRLSKEQVWSKCHKIHFYCCIKEYFELKEYIPKAYLELVMAEPSFLELLWFAHLKREGTLFRTWDEIESLIDSVLVDWSQLVAG